MVTRVILLVILQCIKVPSHYVVDLKLILFVSYNSVFKILESKKG